MSELKPKMKHCKSIDDLPLPCVATAKIDGEFNVLSYNVKQVAVMENRFGRKRLCKEVPAMEELCRALQDRVASAKMLVELYVLGEDGKPSRLDRYLSRRNHVEELRIAVFDLVELNGDNVSSENYLWKMDVVASWLGECKKAHVVHYELCNTREDLHTFYDYWVGPLEAQRYEGVVARTDTDIYKVKKVSTVDAVIIAFNKRSLWKKGMVTSFKIAVMNPEGEYVVLSDVASGIDLPLRSALYKILANQPFMKVSEDAETVWIRPVLVVEVEYTETYEAESPVLKHDREIPCYKESGKTPFYSLREPRLLRFRQDKKATPEEIGLDQF